MNKNRQNIYSEINWEFAVPARQTPPAKRTTARKYSHTTKKSDAIPHTKTITKEIDFSLFYYAIILCSAVFLLLFLSIAISKAAPINVSNEFALPLDRATADQAIEKLIDGTKESTRVELPDTIPISKKISFRKYRVKNNETISDIAKQAGIRIDTIALCNTIKNSRSLKSGTLIVIPNQDGRLITVKQNDSVYKIANRYGVSWKKIADTNELTSVNIAAGSKMFIPGAGMSEYERKQFTYVPQKIVVSTAKAAPQSNSSTSAALFDWPIRGRITSYFGMRLDPFKKVYIFHSGLDIKGNEGDPIYAPMDGTVAFTGWTNIYGNFILIKHSNKLVTLYGHLSSIDVKKGDIIKKNSFIGKVGTTGRSTGPHLHFEVRKNNVPVDPLPLLNGRKG